MFIILLLSLVQSGHIYSGPINILYPIATKARFITLTFALESGLDDDEYLKIAFPFAIHSSSLSGQLTKFFVDSSGSDSSWDPQQQMESGVGDKIIIADNVVSSTLSDNIYTFNFNVTLTSNTWYQITLIPTSYSTQTVGYKNPIRMWTISSLDNSAIIYDENPSFGSIALQDYPSKTLNLTLNTTLTTPGQEQLLQITIIPTILTKSFLIELDSDFIFNTTTPCEILDCTCVTQLNSQLLIECPTQFINTPLQLNLSIINAPILLSATQSTSITVYSLTGITFLEYGSINKALQLQKILLTVSMELLFGLLPDNDLVSLYKPSTVTPNGYPFNNVKIKFQLDQSTPIAEHLVIVTTGEADAVLDSSIAHNLGGNVTCYFRKSVTAIYCKGVQQLMQSTQYFVAFKCAFKNTALNPQINFGRVTIKSIVRTTVSYLPYILAGPTGSNVKIQNSEEFQDPAAQGLSNFGNNYVISGSSTSAFATAYTPANGMTVGLQLGVQRLLFYLKVNPTQMCPSSRSYCGAGKTPELFMKVLFNYNTIKVDNTSSLELSATCGSACSTTFEYYSVDVPYILFKCTKNYNTCSQLFSGAKGFAFQGEIISHTSLYPSNKVLDFIVAFYEGNAGTAITAATLVSVQLIQGYTLSYDVPTVNGAFINYYTDGTSGNTALIMPTMLRLLGAMSGASTNLGILVDGSINQFYVSIPSLTQLDDDDGITTPQIIKSSINDTYWYPHQGTIHSYPDHYINQRLLLIKGFSGSENFDILIALKNNPILPKSIVLLALNQNADSNNYDILNAVRVFGAAFQIPNLLSSKTYYDQWGIQIASVAWNSASAWNNLKPSGNLVPQYKVVDPTLLKTGSAITLTISSAHTDSSNLVNVNTSPLYGAGFTVVGITSFTPIFTGGTCILFSDIMFCPYDLPAYNDNAATNTIEGSYQTPNDIGIGATIPFKYAWSTNSGNLAALQIESQLVSQFQTGCTMSDWDGIYPNTKRQPITFKFQAALSHQLSIGSTILLSLTLSQRPRGFSSSTYCILVGKETLLSCSMGGSGTSATFTLTALVEVLLEGENLIQFFVSHSGLDVDAQTITGQLKINSFPIEDCGESNLSFLEEDSLPSTLLVSNFILQNQNLNTKSSMRVDFQLNNRIMMPGTLFSLTLGFLGSSNSQLFSSNNAKCKFYQNGLISRHWSYVEYLTTKELYFLQKQKYLMSGGTYTLYCLGMRNPDNSLTDPVVISWIDSILKYKIQSASIAFTALLTDTTLAIKVNKYLNTPGMGAYYELIYTPTKSNMTHNGRIYVEFSSAIQIKLQPECYLNEEQIDCFTDFERRVTVLPAKSTISRIKPNVQYTLRIGPIQQPKSMDSFGKIWLAIDLDGDQTNGYQEDGYVTDPALQSTLPSIIPKVSVTFTTFYARTEKAYLRCNFTSPIRAVNIDKLLVIEMNDELAIPNLGNIFECRLYRDGDTSKFNFSSKCEVKFNRLIQIFLKYDQANARAQVKYTLEIRSFRTPDWVSNNPLQTYFPMKMWIYFTDLSLENVYYIAPNMIQYHPKALIFQAPSQEQLQWYNYNEETNVFTKLTPIIGFSNYPVFTVSRGLFNKNYLVLGSNNPTTLFKRQMQLSLSNNNIFSLFGKNYGFELPQLVDPNPDLDPALSKYSTDILYNSTSNMYIEIGDTGYQLQIAALENIGSGLYYIKFTSTITDERKTYTGGLNYQDFNKLPFYSLIPYVAIKIETSTTCNIVLQGNNKIPINGMSQPLIVSTDCIPLSELIITPVVEDPIQKTDPIIISQGAMQKFKISNPLENLIYYFIFQAGDNGVANDIHNVTFTLSGLESSKYSISYFPLTLITNQVDIEIVLNATWNETTSIAQTTCSKDGTLYFSVSSLGLTSWDQKSIYTDILTIQGNLINMNLNQLLNPMIQYLQYYKQANAPNPTNQDSLRQRQILFGMIGEQRVSKMTTISKNIQKNIQVTNIQSNHQLQLYCQDQYGQKSNVFTTELTTTDQGKNHSLITLSFSREISKNQINNLVCSLRELLTVQTHHVLDINCQLCNLNLLNYTKKTWNEILGLNDTVDSILTQSLNVSDSTHYQLYLYFNNYPFSNGDTTEMNTLLYNYINSLDNSTDQTQQFAKKITNMTADPELTYLLKYITIQNYTEQTHAQAQNQVTFQANITSSSIDIAFTKTEGTILFMAIHNAKTTLDFSNPLILRQGITGNGITIEGSALLITETTYKFTISNSKYFLQWSSAPLLGNCLAQSYQDTQLLVLEYTGEKQSHSEILGLIIICIFLF